MPVIEELIKVEKDGSISFGNYELDTKAKLDNFDVNGDIYKVKTFNEITKLEENGNFVYGNREYVVDLENGCLRQADVSDSGIGICPAFCLPQA